MPVPADQPLITATTGRQFACSPAAVLVFIVNAREEILLLKHPRRSGWEVVNGALDAGETVMEAALRETREEAGPGLRARPLGVLHATTFHFDPQVRFMISLMVLAAHESGEAVPGDDMRGSEVRWWPLAEIMAEGTKIIVPPEQKWVFARAVELYRLWKDQSPPLQPPLDPLARNKYTDQKKGD